MANSSGRRFFVRESRLALALFVLGILANDRYATLTSNDLALVAYFFY